MLYDAESGEHWFSPAHDVHVLEGVAAGDAFNAGLVHALINDFDPQDAVNYAIAASILKLTIKGDSNLVGAGEARKTDDRLHDGPGLEGGLLVDLEERRAHPEASIVDMRECCGATADGKTDGGTHEHRGAGDRRHGGHNARSHGHGHDGATDRGADERGDDQPGGISHKRWV